MEEVLILDERPTSTANLNQREPDFTHLEQNAGVALNENDVGGSKNRPKGQTPYTITVCVSRGNQGYGFSVAWTKPPRVERVEPGLPADLAGLKPGDYIIFVGEYNVVKYGEEAVLQIIRECGETIVLEVYRRGVSKAPRGLVNGYANRPSVSDASNSNESHPRKRLSHITFNTEVCEQDRQHIIYALINCEQAFCHSCRFGLERYLIPLKFRTDLITHSQYGILFNNMDQLVDLSETLVDRLMGNQEDAIDESVGLVYYQLLEELADHYSKYFSGLPEADKILAHKLHDPDFRDFLLVPQIPRKKPDITTFIHKPAEHLRELLGLLTQIYSSSPGHNDNTYLDTVLDRLKACYRTMTSQQNIMEPSPQQMSVLAGSTQTTPLLMRSPAPLRPPLVSVSDIEQRLVFTKYTQPFRLHDSGRQWVFGGELYKFEGRHLKQYWAMLFTDLLLFTKINRDRVIFVMEDPVPLNAVCHALFTVKKKATEFRLIVDSSMKVSGTSASYMTLPKAQGNTKKKKNINNPTTPLGRDNKRTLVLRAPTIELKATWNNLIQRQLYVCQQLPSPQQLYGESAPSLARAVSTDGLHSTYSSSTGRFSCSVGDLRGGAENEEIILDLGDVQPRGSSKALFKSSRITVGKAEDREEELDLNLDDEQIPVPSSLQCVRSVPSPQVLPPRVNSRQVSLEAQNDLVFDIQDEGRQKYSAHVKRSSKSSKIKQKGRKGGQKGGGGGGGGQGGGGGGGQSEKVVFHFIDDTYCESIPHLSESSQMHSALYSRSQSLESVPEVVVSQNTQNGAADRNDPYYGVEDDEEDFTIEDARIEAKYNLDQKKGKGIGSKVKDKLFPNRHLPKKKKMNRTKKVEKFVDSITVEDLNHGRVTPVFDREDDLTPDDFAQKRQNLLQNPPKKIMEDEEVIMFDDLPVATTSQQLSPMRAELMMAEERRQVVLKRKEEKKKGMRLEGIEEESPDHCSRPYKPVVSPEAYEEYIGDTVENDYPELAGGSNKQTQLNKQEQEQLFAQREQELYEEEEEEEEDEEEQLLLLLQKQQQEYQDQQQEYQQQQQQEYQEQQKQQLEQQPSGPLSGSASMSFMDDHSPTSNGMADSPRIKRYGSSCDIAQFGVYGESAEEATYISRNNDFNANMESFNLTSKVGGTGTGAFVAGKLAVFEKVVEEEHQKFIECQEVRKRIFRPPKKSGEYIEKFYSPQVIESIDARASVRSRSLRYYDDVFDSDDNPRSPVPLPDRAFSPPSRNSASPYTGYHIPETTSYSIPETTSYSTNPCTNIYFSSSEPPVFPVSPPPPPAIEDEFDYSVYDFIGDRPASRSPTPTYDDNDTRQCSPDSQLYAEEYIRSKSINDPGPSSAPQGYFTDSLEKQTDEVMEMLDNSYLDMNDVDAVGGPSEREPGYSNHNGDYEVPWNSARSRTPSPLPLPDPLDDVFEIEEEDTIDSVIYVGHKRKAAPPPPPPPPNATASTSDNKKGGFFNRVKKDKDKDKERDKAKIKKDKKEREKKDKDKDKDKAAGKRFQLFGGAKKTYELNEAEGAEARSPKKDKKDAKGKRRLFGRGKENFIGRSPHISQKSDPQVARMTGDSFDLEETDEETEYL